MKSVASKRDCEEPIKFSDFRKLNGSHESSKPAQITIYYLITVNRRAMRALIIGPTLMAVSQFSGTFVLVQYAVTIFSKSGSDIDPRMSSIVMASLQLFGTYLTSVVIDKVGRKVLLIVSASGTALGLSVMATYMHLHQLGYNVSQLRLIPMLSLSFVQIVASLGLVPVPYVIIAEVLPRKVSCLVDCSTD